MSARKSEDTLATARKEELDLLFGDARTHSAWLDRPVDDALLRRLYELTRMGPTGGNSHPMRVVFVKSREAKEKLRPALAPLNVEKTMTAPVTAVIAWDTEFYEKMPKLFPERFSRPEAKAELANRPKEIIERQGIQSATLQAGYLILAARALGLDCGPMGGFDIAKTDAAFFPDGKFRTLLLVNLGYGDRQKLFPRLPRLDFDEACRIE